ncbi:MAG: YhbY family RNA-binding protein [Mogibacterium sp.]|nr:YhbY family RNA-binding protein [Mogibacterium sp.]MBQ6500541.1 YhbY family RNA-binding protein [Mogibacterium sp.]
MITGKQRSELKKLAQEIKPTVMIGKEDITPSVIAAIDDYLSAHELVKVQIQEGSMMEPKEAANEIAEELGAEFVQAIGRRFVLYRRAADPDKRKIYI